MREGERAEVGGVPRHFAGEALRLLRERRRLRIEVHEHEVAEHLHLHRSEEDPVRIEVLDQLRAARPVQAAAEIVDPGVVGAGDEPGRARTLQQLVPAVLADVVEGAQRTVLAANRDDASILNARGDVAPGLAQRLLVAEVLPASPEDLLALDLQVVRTDVAVRPDGGGPGSHRVVAVAGLRQLPRGQSCSHGAGGTEIRKAIPTTRAAVRSRRRAVPAPNGRSPPCTGPAGCTHELPSCRRRARWPFAME